MKITFRKGKRLYIIEINIKDGNASFSGTLYNKRILESHMIGCGQLQDSIICKNEYEKKLVELWNRWNLNYMHPYCEHQKALWDCREEVQVNTWKYTYGSILYKRREKTKKVMKRKLANQERVKLGQLTAWLLFTKLWLNNAEYNALSDYQKKFFMLEKTETKTVGWLYEKEHPKGILTKPCPVCGYKYGTDWKKEELPEDLMETLLELKKKIEENDHESENRSENNE
jgi:hypothetical protein